MDDGMDDGMEDGIDDGMDFEELADRIESFVQRTIDREVILRVLQDESNVEWSALLQEYVSRDFTDNDIWNCTRRMRYIMDEVEDFENLDANADILQVSDKMAVMIDEWMKKLDPMLSSINLAQVDEDDFDSLTVFFMQLWITRTMLLMAHGFVDRADAVHRQDPARPMYNAMCGCYRGDHEEGPIPWLQLSYTALLQETDRFRLVLNAVYSHGNPWALLGMSELSPLYSRVVHVARMYDKLMLQIIARFCDVVNRAL